MFTIKSFIAMALFAVIARYAWDTEPVRTGKATFHVMRCAMSKRVVEAFVSGTCKMAALLDAPGTVEHWNALAARVEQASGCFLGDIRCDEMRWKQSAAKDT